MLEVSHQRDERGEIPVVGGAEGFQIEVAVAAGHHQRELSGLYENQRRNRLRQAAVAVLGGMYLHETMMQPRRAGIGRNSLGGVLAVRFAGIDDSVVQALLSISETVLARFASAGFVCA